MIKLNKYEILGKDIQVFLRKDSFEILKMNLNLKVIHFFTKMTRH